MKLTIVVPSVSIAAASFLLPQAQAQTPILAPGQPIVGVAAAPGSTTSSIATVGTVAGQNNYPGNESPSLAIDGLVTTKYLNFAEVNTGFIVTVTELLPIGYFQFTTANDAPERDPITFSIEGTFATDPTTAAGNAVWTSIYSGPSTLEFGNPGRQSLGFVGAIAPNTSTFNTYRLLVTRVRNGGTANSMQFSEIQLYTIPEPSTVALLAWEGSEWRSGRYGHARRRRDGGRR